MSDILCVTNRALCKGDFLAKIEEIAKAAPSAIVLREKDLPEGEYKSLTARVMEICERNGIPCILHSFINAAIELNCDKIHLPLHILRGMSSVEKEKFSVLGASCHSVEDALEAEKLGSTYITAGHVFATDCKKGIPPRGIDFLKNVCQSVSIPVYAIGGIDEKNIAAVRNAGAAGACIMSGLMCCHDAKHYMQNFQKAGENIETY
ncbi:MAG: thiamine phosphate synthase [Firmicutes bacterium]|nr:thiamine phosphate synthase [Bacillota bacterium]